MELTEQTKKTIEKELNEWYEILRSIKTDPSCNKITIGLSEDALSRIKFLEDNAFSDRAKISVLENKIEELEKRFK